MASSVGGRPSGSATRWAASLLLDCAEAIAGKDTERVKQLLWVINEAASPYGDCEQRLAWAFLQALFCRVAASGPRTLAALSASARRHATFDSMRRTLLRFQDVSPWTTFGHTAANGALLESLEGEPRVHVIDLSDSFGTQWPTLLEALATRPEGAPHLRLTWVRIQPPPNEVNGAADVAPPATMMAEVGARLEKFARLMGVPFEFDVIGDAELLRLTAPDGGADGGAAVVVNCMQGLHRIPPHDRDRALACFRAMAPKLINLVEDDVDLTTPSSSVSVDPNDDVTADRHEFVYSVREAFRFYSSFFDSLDESFPRTSSERLFFERAACRALVATLACDGSPPMADREKRERSHQWCERVQQAGFSLKPYSDDVLDDVKALLKRYREGWGVVPSDHNAGFSLTWKDESVIFASAWKPS